MQGRSVGVLLDGGSLPDRPLLGEASMIPGGNALRTNEWKLVRSGSRAPELYDLRADRREENNLCAADQTRCQPLLEELRTLTAETRRVQAQQKLPAPKTAVIDEQTRDRLRALGYE
jgi:hypothetical protein